MKQLQAEAKHVDRIASQGFAIVEDLIDSDTVAALLHALATAKIENVENERAGKAFGIRNLLNVVPLTRELANSAKCRSLVVPLLGSEARVVRGVYFDKHKDANWKVAWHQDLTIAVQQRVEVSGYSPWSMKAGIPHVQPPARVLENMLTLRIHLDHADEANGALRVVAGTHQHGRLNAPDIEYWKEHGEIHTCAVKRGDALLMRPLLLHSSSTAHQPTHRRVLHFEYSATDLSTGLTWFEAGHQDPQNIS